MNPGKVDSGKYKIVFSGKMMGAMLSTFASVFSAEAVQQGISLLKGKEQAMVASEQVTSRGSICRSRRWNLCDRIKRDARRS